MSIQWDIANTARAINRQIEDLAEARKRIVLNIVVLDDGKIHQIEDHAYLEQLVEDRENVLKDMLRHLDELIKERDGIES